MTLSHHFTSENPSLPSCKVGWEQHLAHGCGDHRRSPKPQGHWPSTITLVCSAAPSLQDCLGTPAVRGPPASVATHGVWTGLQKTSSLSFFF